MDHCVPLFVYALRSVEKASELHQPQPIPLTSTARANRKLNPAAVATPGRAAESDTDHETETCNSAAADLCSWFCSCARWRCPEHLCPERQRHQAGHQRCCPFRRSCGQEDRTQDQKGHKENRPQGSACHPEGGQQSGTQDQTKPFADSAVDHGGI